MTNDNFIKINMETLKGLTNPPRWLKEFPDFDHVPAMDSTVHDKWYGDSTWDDVSWKNDICPSFQSIDIIDGKLVRIFSDYHREDLREIPITKKYGISLHEHEGAGACGDYIKSLLETDDINDVYEWILKQEQANELSRREAIKNKETGKRKATIEDMRSTRKWCINMYDALNGQDPDLDGESGFLYFGAYHIEIKPTGEFYLMVGNREYSESTLEKTEEHLWYDYLCGEEIMVEISPLAALIAEYDDFLANTGLPSLSADELIMETKPDSDEQIANKWQRAYLADFIARWEAAEK